MLQEFSTKIIFFESNFLEVYAVVHYMQKKITGTNYRNFLNFMSEY